MVVSLVLRAIAPLRMSIPKPQAACAGDSKPCGAWPPKGRPTAAQGNCFRLTTAGCPLHRPALQSAGKENAARLSCATGTMVDALDRIRRLGLIVIRRRSG